MDPIAAQARAEHRAAQEANCLSGRHRRTRDRLIRQLRERDPKTWTYAALGKAVGISQEMVAHIIKNTW